MLFSFHNSFSQEVNYYEDIKPFIQTKCIQCHDGNSIGPIDLTSYDKVVDYSNMISFVLQQEIMPPFLPDTLHHLYSNARQVTEQEIEDFREWIATEFTLGIEPSNQEYNNPQKRSSSTTRDTFCMEDSFEHYGIYYDQFQVFPLLHESWKQPYATQIRILPGNQKIVRSVVASLNENPAVDKLEEWDPRLGYFSFGDEDFNVSTPHISTWFPGNQPSSKDKDIGIYLPDNQNLIFHIHYGPYGQKQKDKTCAEIEYISEPVQTRQVIPMAHPSLLTESFFIKENATKRVRYSMPIPHDIHLLSVYPVALLLCEDWEIYMTDPNGKSTLLLKIDEWNFHWKENYYFKEPIQVPANSEITIAANYNNQIDNPFNPSTKKRTIQEGSNMFEETFKCYFEIIDHIDPNYAKKANILKRFTQHTDADLEIQLDIYEEDHYKIVVEKVGSEKITTISEKVMHKGRHTFQPGKELHDSGVYIISLYSGKEVVDRWWFIQIEE